jgi:acetylornithine deacetylase
VKRLARDYLTELVAFDTTSSKSNLECQKWICGTLASAADDVVWVHDPVQAKANLIIRIGPAVPGGIVLSGHTDVVPVQGQSWTADPFAVAEREGRLYGRGTADMKGFVALSMALAARIDKSRLKSPLWLALSYDEEIGCFGVPGLIAALVQREDRPSAVIVGEPTGMRPVNKHKGVSVLRLDVRGKPAHSSLPQLGSSAIVTVASIISYLNKSFAARRVFGPFSEGLVPPYSTFNAGRIEGGSAVNIIPAACSLDFEVRNVPEENASGILNNIERFIAEELTPGPEGEILPAEIRLSRKIWCPSLEPERDGAAERLALDLTGLSAAGSVPFGTEAGFFQKAKLSAIVCGPGSIMQAHQPDEFIELAEFQAGVEFMERLGQRLNS